MQETNTMSAILLLSLLAEGRADTSRQHPVIGIPLSVIG
jgi:hypothetical protein